VSCSNIIFMLSMINVFAMGDWDSSLLMMILSIG